MYTETIRIEGARVITLAEMLRPGLRAVLIGLNPSPVSVAAGHYYQGRLGQRLWQRLAAHGILADLPAGAEDAGAFAQSVGFADLVRRPTARAKDLTREELVAGAADLCARLERHVVTSDGCRPLIIFVFAAAETAAGALLQTAGYRTARLPGPYAARGDVARALARLRKSLRA